MNDAASEAGTTGDGAAPRISLGKGRALVAVPRPAPRPDPLAGLGRSHALVAAGVAAVMGLGFAAGTAALASRTQGAVLAQAQLPVAPSPMPPSMSLPISTPTEAAADALARVQGELRSLRAGLDGLRAAADDDRQVDALRGLKRAVDALKQEVEGAKLASAAAVGQLGARIEKLDREPDPKAGDARTAEAKAAEVKATENKAAEAKAADARVAQVASQLNARLDRLERQMASGDATGSIPRDATAQLKAPLPPPRAAQATAPSAAQSSAQPVAQASAPSPVVPAGQQAVPAPAVVALPPPRPESARTESARTEPARAEAPRPELLARADPAAPPRQPEAAPRPATVDGWLLRDVYGGVALVEGRAGGLREVAPGEYVPGVGEIRSIERRGRGWVVVTSRGLIQADNRW